MSVRDITGDVKGHGKPCQEHPHDKKTHEANLVKILRIKKQVRNTNVFAKVSRNHGK